MNAEEARRKTAENEERQMEIEKLIKKGEKSIESTVKRGYRRYITIFPGWCDNNGNPQYPEVIEHFRKLGYNVKFIYGTSLYEVRW